MWWCCVLLDVFEYQYGGIVFVLYLQFVFGYDCVCGLVQVFQVSVFFVYDFGGVGYVCGDEFGCWKVQYIFG